VTVSYDPSVRPALLGDAERARPEIAPLVALSDVVKVSEEDVRWLYPDRSDEDVAQGWLASGPALVVVARGGVGVYAVSARLELRRGAVPIDLVDTVGAGDSFTSGLLDGLHRADLIGGARRDALAAIDEATLGSVIDAAVQVAAITCSKPGAGRRAPMWTPLCQPNDPHRAAIRLVLEAAHRRSAPLIRSHPQPQRVAAAELLLLPRPQRLQAVRGGDVREATEQLREVPAEVGVRRVSVHRLGALPAGAKPFAPAVEERVGSVGVVEVHDRAPPDAPVLHRADAGPLGRTARHPDQALGSRVRRQGSAAASRCSPTAARYAGAACAADVSICRG
jgi:hypothetical protein